MRLARRSMGCSLVGFSVLDDVDEIVSDTGGETFVMGRDSSEIVSSVESALGSADDNISVELQPFGDFSGLVQSITPVFDGANPGDAFTNVSPGDTVDFEVTFDRGSFASGTRQTFSFRFKVVAEGVATIQEVPVTVILR